MVEQFSRDEKVNVPDESRSYSYEELVGTTYKLVDAADYYVYDKTYHVYKDKTEDKKYMKQLVQNGEDVKIVGVVQPSSSATATMLKAGIGYPAELTMHRRISTSCPPAPPPHTSTASSPASRLRVYTMRLSSMLTASSG